MNMEHNRPSRLSISEAKFLLPASISLRRSRLEPEKYQEIKLDSFKVIGFLGSGMKL